MADVLILNLSEPALYELLNSPTGEVADDLNQRANRVLGGARVDVGVDTGLLLSSLHVDMSGGRTGPTAAIGSDVPYALDHHEGTPPHQIRARSGRALVFNMNGVRIYRREVSHPGTRANPFLAKNLFRALG